MATDRQLERNEAAHDRALTNRDMGEVTEQPHELTDFQRAALRAARVPETWEAWLKLQGYETGTYSPVWRGW